MSKDKSVYNGVPVPIGGRITIVNGKPLVPNKPIIPYIEGDGIGPEITAATHKIINEAVERAYFGARKIVWYEIFAGAKAKSLCGEMLPADTLSALSDFVVSMKGPLETPRGGGHRSNTVAMRKAGDYYSIERPVRYFHGVPSVVNHPEKTEVVIFREGTEDIYVGIEFEMGTAAAKEVIDFIRSKGFEIPDDAGIGIKYISRNGSRRLVRRAIQHAINNGLKTVTLVHKGNIQKYTEGAFCKWGYELAAEEFADVVITEAELRDKYNWQMPVGKILLNDRIADAMFAEALLKPDRYQVIATTNLNGDYFSDDIAAIVGGLGIAPGSNIGDKAALYEATHGIAEDIAGKNMANPCSLLLSGEMMLRYMGWNEAADLIVAAVESTIKAKSVTADFARFINGAKALSTTEFTDAVIANMAKPAPILPVAANSGNGAVAAIVSVTKS